MYSDDHSQSAAPDQTMNCIDCSATFVFTGGEQEFYASKQLTPPKRCADCRKKKKAMRNGGFQRSFQREQRPSIEPGSTEAL